MVLNWKNLLWYHEGANSYKDMERSVVMVFLGAVSYKSAVTLKGTGLLLACFEKPAMHCLAEGLVTRVLVDKQQGF